MSGVGGGEISALVERLRRFRDARDWAQFHNPKDLAVSVAVEAAELLELFQWRRETLTVDRDLAEGVAGEAADVLLYLLMLCDQVGIDLVDAANAKIDRNEARFPVDRTRGVAKPGDEGGVV